MVRKGFLKAAIFAKYHNSGHVSDLLKRHYFGTQKIPERKAAIFAKYHNSGKNHSSDHVTGLLKILLLWGSTNLQASALKKLLTSSDITIENLMFCPEGFLNLSVICEKYIIFMKKSSKETH